MVTLQRLSPRAVGLGRTLKVMVRRAAAPTAAQDYSESTRTQAGTAGAGRATVTTTEFGQSEDSESACVTFMLP